MELLKWCRLQWDRVLGGLGMAGGVVMLLVGWAHVSSTEFVAAQIPYVVSAGLGGLALLMIGATLWLSADVRDEFRSLDRIEDALAQGDGQLAELAHRLEVLEARGTGVVPESTNGSKTPRRTVRS